MVMSLNDMIRKKCIELTFQQILVTTSIENT